MSMIGDLAAQNGQTRQLTSMTRKNHFAATNIELLNHH